MVGGILIRVLLIQTRTTGLGRLTWDYTHLHHHCLGREARYKLNTTKKQLGVIGFYILHKCINNKKFFYNYCSYIYS